MPRKYLSLSIILVVLVAAFSLAIFTWLNASHSRVVVEWETASELNTAGFNVYRGTDPQKVDLLLNKQLISSAKDPLTGGKYQYRDNSTRPGVTYYYIVEEVEVDGSQQRYGPIKVVAQGYEVYGWIAAGLLAFAGLAGSFYWITTYTKRNVPVGGL